MKESNKEKYEKKIKKLEERVRKLEEERERVKEERVEEAGETSAGEILKSVGNMFGIGGLIKSVENLPEFQDRLKTVDAELKRKLGTKRAEERTPYPGRGFRARPSARVKPGIRKETPAPREREVDIFDEKDHVMAILEIPGADEKSIKVNLEKDKLSISADKAGKKYHKKVILPCVPKGKLTKSYKNGILEIKIMKS